MRSTTSSIRLPTELRSRLEKATQDLKRKKNSIVTQALTEYLEKVERTEFLEQARKQSILASAAPTDDEDFWADHADTREWN